MVTYWVGWVLDHTAWTALSEAVRNVTGDHPGAVGYLVHCPVLFMKLLVL